MRIVALLLVAACSSSPEPDVYAIDCIETVNTGSIAWHGPRALVLTSSCAGATSRLSLVQWIGQENQLEELSSVGFESHTRAMRIVDLDGSGPADPVSLIDNGFGYSVWFSGATSFPRNVTYTRRVDDLTTSYVDGGPIPDVLVAGDSAIRVAFGTDPLTTSVAPTDDVDLLTGKAFGAIAAQLLPGKSAPDLYYVARGADGDPFELGVARATTNPLAYSVADTASIPNGPLLPLVIADVDGDQIGDVIGGTSQLFVRSSHSGTVSFLDEDALAIAAGDLDADGVIEPVFLSRDGKAVKRVHVAADGSLAAETVLDTDARALAVDDLDADGRADIAVVEGKLGYAGTRLLVYR